MQASLLARSVSAAILVSLATTTAGAQQPAKPSGNNALELGLFGQIDWLDKAMQTERVGKGLGGRLGWFIRPSWELEGEASLSRVAPSAQRIQSGDVQVNYYIGRLNYNVPLGRASAILGAGAGADALDDHNDLILSPLVGVRLPVAEGWYVRLDASMMFAPNPTSATYKFPPGAIGAGRNDGAAYLTNYQARIGVSYMPTPRPALVTIVIQPRGLTLQLPCSLAAEARTPVGAQLSDIVTSDREAHVSQAAAWRSSNPAVAMVDPSSGYVTALGEGETRVTATAVVDHSKFDEIRVIVKKAPPIVAARRWADTSWKVDSFPGLDTAIFFATDSPKVARHGGLSARQEEQLRLNSRALRATAIRVLNSWVAHLKAEPADTVRITAWADQRYDSAYNVALSLRRANAVVEYLRSSGIDSARITPISGKGSTTAFGSGRDSSSLQSNRRVRLEIDLRRHRTLVETWHDTPATCQP